MSRGSLARGSVKSGRSWIASSVNSSCCYRDL